MYEEFQKCFSPNVEYQKLRHLQKASGEPPAAPAGSLFVENRAATVEYLPTRIHGGSRGFSRPGGNPSKTPLFVEKEGGEIPGEPPILPFWEFLL